MDTLRPATVLALVAAASFIGAAPAAKGCSGFDGTWQSAWSEGTTILKIRGTAGTYDYKDGRVTGTIDGNVFSGRYAQSNGTGTFRLTLAADGASFSGSYVTSNAETGPWTGVCAGPP